MAEFFSLKLLAVKDPSKFKSYLCKNDKILLALLHV